MTETTYHHGDLRTAMIEKGIALINETGAGTLSLRKLAAACGVSHAAPYSHFANKEDLLSAITDHITQQFATILKDSVKETGETPEGLFRLGCAYVMFFLRNPAYFRFIFSRSDIAVGDGHPYEPYDFYRRFMVKLFENIGYPKEYWQKIAIAQWAMIHGLAAIAIMDVPKDIPMWEARISDMLSNNYLILPKESTPC
ncbi:MAG: TetR/AcrR family transcriptional regulator [Defluviitaleaceae bacterium]|nr:TetR/AcrR family transcriptional regulator [Defluviitaleaceae bacterium]